MVKNNTILICFTALVLMGNHAFAFFDEREPALAPLTLWTSDVLRPGEVFFSPWGWTACGINDRVTLELDWMLAVGLCPAGYVKVNYLRHKNLSLSFDVLDYYIWPALVDTVEDLFPEYNSVGYKVSGNMGWLHTTATYNFSTKLRVHATAGLSYHHYYRLWRKEPLPQLSVERTDAISPDLWFGLDYKHSKVVRLLGIVLYGNSFGFWDQVPRKLQIIAGINLAPFPDNWWGIFRRMKFDIGVFNTYFLEIDKEQGWFPAPYMYWQFQLF
jgi:hypothetical protein